MTPIFDAAFNARLLRITGQVSGGVTVTLDDESTDGHLEEGPTEVLEEGNGGYGGVLLGDLSVVIANGTLTGITAKTGIDEVVTITDAEGEETECTIIRIVPPRSDPSGDMLQLVLRRN